MFIKKHHFFRHVIRRERSSYGQDGFTLVELMITLSIVALLGLYAASELSRRTEEVLAEGSGQYIKQVAAAAERHTILNFNQYANSLPVPGVLVALRPTVAELAALGRLNAGFPSGPGSMPTRQTLRIDIRPSLDCPGPNCILTALACTTGPVNLGRPNTRFDLAQTMVDVQGGSGGQSSMNFGNTIRGPGLNVPNPVGNVEGIVCGSSVVDTALYQRFVTIQDTRDPDLQGPLSVAGAVKFAGNMTATGTATAGNFVTAGTATVGKVQLTDTAAVKTACATNGLLAKDATGQMLSCQSNVWQVQGDGKCVATASDLNLLQEDGRCYNSAGNPNSPAGADWFFVEVYRHINPTNFYTVQRAFGMTGASAGKAWMRNQQSGTSGTGWSPWVVTSSTATVGAACSPEGSMSTSPTNVALLCVNGQFRGMDTIVRSGTPGAACPVPGATAIDTANANETLLCRANPSGGTARYMRLREMTQNLMFVSATEVQDWQANASGNVTKPNCASPAIAIIQLLPKTLSTKDGGISIFADDPGPYWRVYLRNGDGSVMAASTAIAQTFCYFP